MGVAVGVAVGDGVIVGVAVGWGVWVESWATAVSSCTVGGGSVGVVGGGLVGTSVGSGEAEAVPQPAKIEIPTTTPNQISAYFFIAGHCTKS